MIPKTTRRKAVSILAKKPTASTERVRPVSVVTNPPPESGTRKQPVSSTNAYIGKGLGEVLNLSNIVTTNNIAGPLLTSPVTTSLWRLRILLNRGTSAMPKATGDRKTNKAADATNYHIPKEGSYSTNMIKDPWTSNKVAADAIDMGHREYLEGNAQSSVKDHSVIKRPAPRNDILIINTNTSPATTIVIQNRPNELSVEPVPTWGEIKSMGRNNPFMIYGGSVDTIQFEVSWYATDEQFRDDVVNKCKLLESWTKADGYTASPPNLKIVWGDSGLYDDAIWVLTGASYRLANFQDYAFIPDPNEPNARQLGKGEFQNLKLNPNTATQTLTFKRVTIQNLTHEDIISSSKLERTPGVIYTQTNEESLE